MTRHNTHDDGTGSTTRRDFVKIGVGAGATAAGIVAGSRPAAAQYSVVGSTLASNRGVQYLVGRIIDKSHQHFGTFGNPEEAAESRSLYLQARQDAKTIQASNDNVLTSIENLAENAKTVAYMEGRSAFLEALNEDQTPTAALTPAKQAVDDYIVPNQKNIVARWDTMLIQVDLILQRADDVPDISRGDIFRKVRTAPDGYFNNNAIQGIFDTEITLADGSTITTKLVDQTADKTNTYHPVQIGSIDQEYISQVEMQADPDTGDGAFVITDRERFTAAFDNLAQAAVDAKSEIDALYNGIQDSYTSGDISTEDIATPSDFFSMASDDSATPYAAADLAGLGLEVNQKSSIVIDLLDDGTSLEGSVYLSKSPIGESLAAGNVYDPTASRSTDGDGNPNDTIDDYEGTEADPIPLDGLTFIAYNTDDGSTYGQIEQPFRVEAVYGEDGEELQAASYQPATGQQTTTTDIDKLRSELQAMNDEIIELEEERREIATGGGGGGGGGTDLGTLAAAAAGGGLLLALLTGGGGS